MNRRFCKNLMLLLGFLVIGAFLTGCSRDPNVRKQKYFESGKRYAQSGKYREAAIQFSNAVRIDANFADAHYQLALCNFRLGSTQNAYLELSRTVVLQPNNLQAQLDLGNLLLAAHEFQKAEDRADLVLSKDPHSVNAHILKANASTGLREFDRALAEVNTAVQLDPRRADSYANLGVLELAKKSDSPAAEAAFKKSIELDGTAISPRLALADFYDRNRRFAESQQLLQDAIRLWPRNQQLRAAFVRHFEIQNEKDLAEKTAKDAAVAMAANPDGAQFLAMYYLSVNDVGSATVEYKRLAKEFPRERQIQGAYLDLLMLGGNKDIAMKQVEIILKLASKDEHALTAKATLLLQQNKPAEGRDLLQSVIKGNPKNVVARYELGNALAALNQKGQAETQWREAAKIQPEYLPAQKALAVIAVEKRDQASLTQTAKILIEKLPSLPDGYLIQARADAFGNDYKDAEAQLEKAIQVAPRMTQAYVQLARLRLALKRDVDAEEVLDKALKIDPQDNESIATLVQVYLDENRPAEARRRVQDLVATYPNNAGLHLISGELAFSQNDLELAEKETTRANQLAPSNFAGYYQLASVQLRRGELAKAEETFQTAIMKDPQDANAYWMLGTVFEQEKDTKNAEANYRKALQLQPDLAVAANNLAYLLLQNGGNIDQVITFAETARRQMPHAAAVADTLGWAYYQKGASALAVELLKDAVKEGPNRATYHYHLGMAYSKAGDRTNARLELQKAVHLETEQSKKKDIIKSLASLT